MSASRTRLRLTLLRAFAALTRPLRPRRLLALPTAPRILVVRPDHIGDQLFATPALRLLREAFPAGHLTCMVGPWGEAVWKNNPQVDEIIVCEFPAFAHTPKASLLAPYLLLHQWVGRLRLQHFHMAVVLRFDHWWGALLTYLAGIPRRVGYAIPECQEFLTTAIPYASQRHEVLQNLALVEQAAREARRDVPQDRWTLEFEVAAEDEEWIGVYLAEHGVAADDGLVAIHPGAGALVKRWEPDSYADVADAIAHRWGTKLAITGSPDELDLAWSVYARMHSDAIVAAGATSLGQLAALFQRCDLVIGPDCGPLHVAVAVGAPTVHLYGPVDPRKFGPWGDPQRHVVVTSDLECIPCNRLDYPRSELPNHPCVREIAVDSVLEAAEKLLRMGRD